MWAAYSKSLSLLWEGFLANAYSMGILGAFDEVVNLSARKINTNISKSDAFLDDNGVIWSSFTFYMAKGCHLYRLFQPKHSFISYS